MQYFFVLGRHPELSKAEIHSVLSHDRNEYDVRVAHGVVLIVDAEKPLDFSVLARRLGGVTKMGEVIHEIPIAGSRMDAISQYLGTLDADAVFAPGRNGSRTEFGFSVYSLTSDTVPYRTAKHLEREGIRLKKRLKETRGHAIRFVTSRHHDLSSVVIGENHLLETGGDLCFFLAEETVVVGRTRAIQPYAEYSARDYGRPERDARSGMLPPKLAQMMVNLAGAPRDATVLDPFCGSGTIPQEALLLGYSHVIASDISAAAVRDTKANLLWLGGEFDVAVEPRVFVSDARDLGDHLRPASVDAIVTEPYLGPPLTGRESRENLERNARELSALYSGALRVFARLVKPGGRLVMVVPAFRVREGEIHLALSWGGFRSVHFPDWIDTRKFFYGRDDQHLLRNIIVKERK